MENLQESDTDLDLSPKKGRGQYERKPRGSYQKHKLEKKVTVKHFLNTRISISEDDYISHPVYVQITYNRKSTTIKSALNYSFSENIYNSSLITDSSLTESFEREISCLQYAFQKNLAYFSDGLKKEILKNSMSVDDALLESELEKKVNKFYDLEVASKKFKFSYIEINSQIEIALKYEIIQLLNEIVETDGAKMEYKQKSKLISFRATIYEILNNEGISIKAAELLSYLEMQNIKFKEIRNRFTPEIWYFNMYYALLRSDSNGTYYRLGATIYDFRKLDFKEEFLHFFNSQSEIAQNIINDIEILIEKYNL